MLQCTISGHPPPSRLARTGRNSLHPESTSLSELIQCARPVSCFLLTVGGCLSHFIFVIPPLHPWERVSRQFAHTRTGLRDAKYQTTPSPSKGLLGIPDHSASLAELVCLPRGDKLTTLTTSPRAHQGAITPPKLGSGGEVRNIKPLKSTQTASLPMPMHPASLAELVCLPRGDILTHSSTPLDPSRKSRWSNARVEALHWFCLFLDSKCFQLHVLTCSWPMEGVPTKEKFGNYDYIQSL